MPSGKLNTAFSVSDSGGIGRSAKNLRVSMCAWCALIDSLLACLLASKFGCPMVIRDVELPSAKYERSGKAHSSLKTMGKAHALLEDETN